MNRYETKLRWLKGQGLFVVFLTIAFFVRASWDNDKNTALFATVLAFGVILGLSYGNRILIEVAESFNEKYPLLNFCIPSFLPGVLLVIVRAPMDNDVVLFLTVTLVANVLS